MAATASVPWMPPFFTAIDPEIAVKGSVDPLGITPVWSRHGRRLVGNLTVTASSPRGFTTLLLGYWFARRLVDDGAIEEEQFLDVFLTFEQLAAYSRYALLGESSDMRGIRRVMARYAERKGRVPIGPGRDAQILSNQKQYGLWGLFSVPAEDSGLIDRQALRLTEPAETFLGGFARRALDEHHLRDGRAILQLLRKPRTFEPEGKDAAVAGALAALHAPAFSGRERSFYLEHLVHGGAGAPGDRQQRLWALITEVNDERESWAEPFDLAELRRCLRLAETRGQDDLAAPLGDIRRFEAVAAPAARIFRYLQTADGRSLDSVAGDLEQAWGSALARVDALVAGPNAPASALAPVEEVHGEEGRRRFEALARALAAADYATALRLTIEQNTAVMQKRGGGPWIDLGDGLEQDEVRVRHRQDPGELPTAGELRDLWVHPYFLTALKRAGAEVMGKPVPGS